MSKVLFILSFLLSFQVTAQTVKIRVLDSFEGNTAYHGNAVSYLVKNLIVDHSSIGKLTFDIHVTGEDVLRSASNVEVSKYNLQSYSKDVIQATVQRARFFEALRKAGEEGVRIVNYSAGSLKDEPSEFDYNEISFILNHYDMLLVTAAGNQGVKENRYPCAYNNPRIICVSAGHYSYVLKGLNNEGIVLEKYSNINMHTQFVSYGQIGQLHGTSFATPRVTAMLAFLMSNHPHLTTMQIVNKLRSYGSFVDSVQITKSWVKERL